MELHDQLSTELAEGRRVGVLAPTFAASRFLFQGFTDHHGADPALTVRRTAGEERVQHSSGGVVRFGSSASGMWRGLSLDTLVIDGELTDDQLAAVTPVILASTEPHVYRLVRDGVRDRLETVR